VVPDESLSAEAAAVAARLATGPASLASIRRLVWEGMTHSWDDQLLAEGRAQTAAGRTEDFVEGVTAFLQKRPATFRGR
jgi:2-(1,2-epoxy-1,2-dihydrophenyl)acetyl-CoA isomerase